MRRYHCRAMFKTRASLKWRVRHLLPPLWFKAVLLNTRKCSSFKIPSHDIQVFIKAKKAETRTAQWLRGTHCNRNNGPFFPGSREGVNVGPSVFHVVVAAENIHAVFNGGAFMISSLTWRHALGANLVDSLLLDFVFLNVVIKNLLKTTSKQIYRASYTTCCMSMSFIHCVFHAHALFVA